MAVKENFAASTRNQALAALLFLYQDVLEEPLNRIAGVVRARKPVRLPAASAVGSGDRPPAVLTFVNFFPDFMHEEWRSALRRHYLLGDVHWNERGHHRVADRFLATYKALLAAEAPPR